MQDRRLKLQILRNRAERERKQDELEQQSTVEQIEQDMNYNGQNLDLIQSNGLLYRSQTDLENVIEQKKLKLIG